jgi:hypothetical protein
MIYQLYVIATEIVGVDDPVHPGQTESSAPTGDNIFIYCEVGGTCKLYRERLCYASILG